jgi:hypothetical protein
MGDIVLAGSTSGTVTISPPASAGTTTLTLPATSGTIVTSASSLTASQLPAGSVLQVVQSTKSDTASYATNGSWTDFVGFTASITPSSTSNKILIHVSISSGCSGANSPDSLVRLKRGGSVVTGAIGDAAGSRTQGSFSLNTWRSSYELGSASFQYLDSPSSTSSLTYGFDIKTGDTGFINRTYADENGSGGERGISVITLMEIKG